MIDLTPCAQLLMQAATCGSQRLSWTILKKPPRSKSWRWKSIGVHEIVLRYIALAVWGVSTIRTHPAEDISRIVAFNHLQNLPANFGDCARGFTNAQ
jgi:hypothetical protein